MTEGGARIKRRKMSWEQRQFTKLPNDWVRDETLSYRARGILAALMSMQDDWMTSIDALVEQTVKRDPEHKGSPHEGREAIRSAIAELENAGYLIRTKTRTAGKFTVEWSTGEPAPQLLSVPAASRSPQRVDRNGSTDPVGRPQRVSRVGSTASVHPTHKANRVGSTASVHPTIKEELLRRDIDTQSNHQSAVHRSIAQSPCWDRWIGAPRHKSEPDADTSEAWRCVVCGEVCEPVPTLSAVVAQLEAEKRA